MAILSTILGATAGTAAAATAGTAAASTVGAGAAAAGAAGGAAAVGGIGSAVGTAGTVLSALGTGAGIVGQFKQQAAAKKAEKLRERQMDLEAARSRRDIARKAIMARAESLAGATAQGAQFGSGLAGGQAQVTAQGAMDTLGVNQNQEIGKGIFAANRQMASAQTLSSFGQGLQGLGQNLQSNMELYGRLGAYYSYGR